MYIVVEAIDGYDAKGVDVYVIHDIWCDGTEDRLLECGHSDLMYTTCETKSAGVKCLNGKCIEQTISNEPISNECRHALTLCFNETPTDSLMH